MTPELEKLFVEHMQNVVDCRDLKNGCETCAAAAEVLIRKYREEKRKGEHDKKRD